MMPLHNVSRWLCHHKLCTTLQVSFPDDHFQYLLSCKKRKYLFSFLYFCTNDTKNWKNSTILNFPHFFYISCECPSKRAGNSKLLCFLVIWIVLTWNIDFVAVWFNVCLLAFEATLLWCYQQAFIIDSSATYASSRSLFALLDKVDSRTSWYRGKLTMDPVHQLKGLHQAFCQ